MSYNSIHVNAFATVTSYSNYCSVLRTTLIHVFNCHLIYQRDIHVPPLTLVHILLIPTVPHYRALHNYAPQNPDDLELEQGVWVTLLETPAGGGWWKGQVEEGGEGWFPRTYVEYVDIEAEKKRQQDGEFT